MLVALIHHKSHQIKVRLKLHRRRQIAPHALLLTIIFFSFCIVFFWLIASNGIVRTASEHTFFWKKLPSKSLHEKDTSILINPHYLQFSTFLRNWNHSPGNLNFFHFSMYKEMTFQFDILTIWRLFNKCHAQAKSPWRFWEATHILYILLKHFYWMKHFSFLLKYFSRD